MCYAWTDFDALRDNEMSKYRAGYRPHLNNGNANLGNFEGRARDAMNVSTLPAAVRVLTPEEAEQFALNRKKEIDDNRKMRIKRYDGKFRAKV